MDVVLIEERLRELDDEIEELSDSIVAKKEELLNARREEKLAKARAFISYKAEGMSDKLCEQKTIIATESESNIVDEKESAYDAVKVRLQLVIAQKDTYKELGYNARKTML